jgi:hypothetical protein
LTRLIQPVTRTHTYIHTHTHARTRARARTHTHTRIHTHAHAHAHAHTRARARARARTYTHTHRYAIEATCHAPSRQGVYGEIFRVLKPGARFACYEWCLTDKFDKNNQEHQFIKKKIEEGDGLPDMA